MMMMVQTSIAMIVSMEQEGLTKNVCMNRIDNERCSARTVNVMMLQL